MSRSSIRAELAFIEARIIEIRTRHMAGQISGAELRDSLTSLEEKIRKVHADMVQEEIG